MRNYFNKTGENIPLDKKITGDSIMVKGFTIIVSLLGLILVVPTALSLLFCVIDGQTCITSLLLVPLIAVVTPLFLVSLILLIIFKFRDEYIKK